jgi:hypothetical protein
MVLWALVLMGFAQQGYSRGDLPLEDAVLSAVEQNMATVLQDIDDMGAMIADALPTSSAGWSMLIEALPWRYEDAGLVVFSSDGNVLAARGDVAEAVTGDGVQVSAGCTFLQIGQKRTLMVVVRELRDAQDALQVSLACAVPVSALFTDVDIPAEAVCMLMRAGDRQPLWVSTDSKDAASFSSAAYRPSLHALVDSLQSGEPGKTVYGELDAGAGRLVYRRVAWRPCHLAECRATLVVEAGEAGEEPVPETLSGRWSGAYSEHAPRQLADRATGHAPRAGQLDALVLQDGNWIEMIASGSEWSLRANGVFTNGLMSASARVRHPDGRWATWYWQAEYAETENTLRGTISGNGVDRVVERSFFLRRTPTEAAEE